MWAQFEEALAEIKDPRGAPAELTEREFLEAVLYLARNGTPWRDLPAEFGAWSAVYMRFRRWEDAGVWRGLWEVLQRCAASQDVVAPFAKNFAVGDSSRSRLRLNGPHPRPPWLV